MEYENNDIKALHSNIHFFKMNIYMLQALRPNYKVIIEYYHPDEKVLHYRFEKSEHPPLNSYGNLNSNPNYGNDTLYDLLPALNSAIILNCFSLFEGILERRLLEELNTEGLTGIQEAIMSKYIDNVLNLSSLSNYLKEYEFIKGEKLTKSFNAEELESFSLIQKFYTLRHLLVHGSAIKRILTEGKIVMDPDDKKYQELLNAIKTKVLIDLPSNLLNPHTLLINNEVADLLYNSINVVANKLGDKVREAIKLLKNDPRKK